jgi:hypothetical protein
MASPVHLSVEDLKRTANVLLRRSMNALARTGNFDPAIFILGPEGDIASIPFAPGWMNSDRHKERLFGAVRVIARRVRAQAVFMLTDGFAIAYSGEERRRLAEDREYAELYNRMGRSASSISEIVAAGVGHKVESILVTVQSPLYCLLIQQHYERAGADRCHIVFGEQIGVDSNEGGHITGRMAIWDEEEHTA